MASTQITPVPTEAPANAGIYQQVCWLPLPANTFIDAVVQIDPCTKDFYYHCDPTVGSVDLSVSKYWVCRSKVIDPTDVDASALVAGQPVYTQQATPFTNQPQAGALANLVSGIATSLGIPSTLFSGLSSYLLIGAGVAVLILVLLIVFSVLRK